MNLVLVPLWLLYAVVGAFTVGWALATLFLWRWLFWRREFEALRRHHVEAMKHSQAPFLHPLPDLSPVLREIDAIRAEIEAETGNVVHADFSRRER